MQWLRILIFTAAVAHVNSNYGSQCLSTDQQNGLCMPVKSCKFIYELFTRITRNGDTIPESLSKRLLSLHCGTFANVPHVCCPKTEIQLNVEGLNILKNNTCGPFAQNSVANGRKARLFQFPWMALLIYQQEGERIGCAGTLISDQYILTTAHCIKGQENFLTKVRLGEYQMSTPVDCIHFTHKNQCAPPVEDFGIEKLIVHYNYTNIHNDIALIRLNRKVEFKPHIQPICLPIYPELQSKVYDNYVITGWGKSSDNVSDILMATYVPWVDRTGCEQQRRKYRLQNSFNEDHICAGGHTLDNSCFGDSGGPLGYPDFYSGNQRFIQFGIISMEIRKCGFVNVPSIYTNVSYHMQWITDNIKGSSRIVTEV